MINLFEKVRYSLFGERDITSVCNKITKDKKLDDNTKFCTILDKLCEYYVTKKFDHDVAETTYEMYFEKFMITNTVRHEQKYRSYVEMVEREINNVIATTIVRYVKQLKNISEDSLTSKQKKIYNIAKWFANNLYTKEFDYEKIYYDYNFAKELDRKNKALIDPIKDYNAGKYLKQNEERDLFD